MQEEYEHLNQETVSQLRNDMPDDIIIDNLSDLFKVFADRTRVRILFLLMEQEELCVHDIARGMEMEQSAISHQLRILKQARLVRYRRSGKEIIYSICDDHIRKIFEMAIEHVEE